MFAYSKHFLLSSLSLTFGLPRGSGTHPLRLLHIALVAYEIKFWRFK